MNIEIGSTYSLMDKAGRVLGDLHIIEEQGEFWCGKFEKHANFSLYEELFRTHEDLVNHQTFGLLDEIESHIADIGAYLYSTKDNSTLAIHDLQIMNTNDICFRLIDQLHFGNDELTR